MIFDLILGYLSRRKNHKIHSIKSLDTFIEFINPISYNLYRARDYSYSQLGWGFNQSNLVLRVNERLSTSIKVPDASMAHAMGPMYYAKRLRTCGSEAVM